MGVIVMHTLTLVKGFLGGSFVFVGLSSTSKAVRGISDGLLDLILG